MAFAAPSYRPGASLRSHPSLRPRFARFNRIENGISIQDLIHLGRPTSRHVLGFASMAAVRDAIQAPDLRKRRTSMIRRDGSLSDRSNPPHATFKLTSRPKSSDTRVPPRHANSLDNAESRRRKDEEGCAAAPIVFL